MRSGLGSVFGCLVPRDMGLHISFFVQVAQLGAAMRNAREEGFATQRTAVLRACSCWELARPGMGCYRRRCTPPPCALVGAKCEVMRTKSISYGGLFSCPKARSISLFKCTLVQLLEGATHPSLQMILAAPLLISPLTRPPLLPRARSSSQDQR